MFHILTAIFLALTITTVPSTFAESDPRKIIEECNTIYPQLEELGKTKFLQRYMYSPNIRTCFTLYNDIAWFAEGNDRIDRLIALLDGQNIEKPIRDRFEKTESIPQWIKDDASRWQEGKERDNILSYGIRYMINSKMIKLPSTYSDTASCLAEEICVLKDHHIKYSIKDNQNRKVTNLTHTFGTPGKTIAISEIEVTKNGKKQNNFFIDSNGLVENGKTYYRFVHKIPLELDSTIESVYPLKATSEMVFPFKNVKRDVILAWDKTKQYHEVIDKNTGIVIFAKYSDRIKKSEWVAQLADTDMFSEEIAIQYDNMKIPPWFKKSVKSWLEGTISDSEYIATITHLLKNDMMRI